MRAINALGPDGFNFNFIKSFWELIKQDAWGMLQEFLANGKLPKGFTSYFLALIPKVKNPQSLGEFLPISLLGCLYKLLAKVLVSRLRAVMNPIIASNQSAFLPNRNILDGVVVISEVVDYSKKESKECLILKVDFEKVYDLVSCDFLDYMMGRFGMGDK